MATTLKTTPDPNSIINPAPQAMTRDAASGILPRITIVTPTYNRADFLEQTIQSVIGQEYANLEYIIVDGGSTDGTLDIIKEYEGAITHWISEPDEGAADAISKGFALGTGEVMGWLGSDDLLFPWTLQVIGEVFSQCEDVEWISSAYPCNWGTGSKPIEMNHRPGFSRRLFYAGAYLGSTVTFRYWIQQESTFWRRNLWERAGASLAKERKASFDFELWSRLFKHADLYTVDVPLGAFRYHGSQISRNVGQYYFAEAIQSLDGTPGSLAYRLFKMLPYRASIMIRKLLRMLPAQYGRVTYNKKSGCWESHWNGE